MRAAEMWNQIVALKKPKVRDVETLLDCHLQNVYEHAPNFLSAEPNLLLRLPIGRSSDAESQIVSMSLILQAGYLSSVALVKPSPLRGLSVFGIHLEGSVRETMQALQRSQISNLDSLTEKRRWVIYCGKAFAFEFSALSPLESAEPHHSEMVAVSYYFLVPYTGICPPIILAE
jgi:hypothetical protein